MSNFLFFFTLLKNSLTPLNLIEQSDKLIYVTSDKISATKHFEISTHPSFPKGFSLKSKYSTFDILRLFLR